MTGTRGQGYTLEGVIGSLVVLGAVLFAMQSVALTPSSGGSVEVAEQQNLRQQATDTLVLASQNDTFSLSRLARYWNERKQTFHDGLTPQLGYGERDPPGAIGRMLNETFENRSRTYNLELRYLPTDPAEDTRTTPVVFQGEPSDDAVVATQTVTLFDNQTLTSPNATDVELWQYGTTIEDDNGYYPIPNAVEGPVYNVVEVRLIVW
jgi:hypothetical protein